MKKVAVVVSVGYETLAGLVDEILSVLSQYEAVPVVVLACHKDLDPQGCAEAEKTARMYQGGQAAVSLATGKGSFSRAYLEGWRKGAEVADIVVSMDADGAHNPQELKRFLPGLIGGKPAVMASRFLRGASNSFPLQRRVVSWLGTLLTNVVTKPRQHLSDFTSGYEGLQAEVVRELFRTYPVDSWVSVTDGPYHLQNTELRLNVLSLGYSITEVPISYGAKKKGKRLKASYLLQALHGFAKIVFNGWFCSRE